MSVLSVQTSILPIIGNENCSACGTHKIVYFRMSEKKRKYFWKIKIFQKCENQTHHHHQRQIYCAHCNRLQSVFFTHGDYFCVKNMFLLQSFSLQYAYRCNPIPIVTLFSIHTQETLKYLNSEYFLFFCICNLLTKIAKIHVKMRTRSGIYIWIVLQDFIGHIAHHVTLSRSM